VKTLRVFCLTIFLIGISVLISACGSETSENVYQLAPLRDMHSSVQSAPKVVQEAYQFAHANSEILKQVPCYCGCGGMGHTSNYACYVYEAEDELGFDGHALGCSICVDITQDVMRLMNDEQTLTYIQEFVDNKYSAFGPSNIP
jgi:hypothetical protein